MILTTSVSLNKVKAGGCSFGFTQITVQINAASSRHPAEIEWDITPVTDSVPVLSRACGEYANGLNTTDFTCLTIGADYEFNAYDDWGDGWNGGNWSIRLTISQDLIAMGMADNHLLDGDFLSQCSGAVLEEQVIFNSSSPMLSVMGCTDSLAFNYNPDATQDDGSCLFSGCLDPFASNYDPTVDIYDVNTCEYDAPANEDCSDAIGIACGDSVTGILVSASADPSLPDCGLGSLPDAGVWFSFIGTGDVMTCAGKSLVWGM